QGGDAAAAAVFADGWNADVFDGEQRADDAAPQGGQKRTERKRKRETGRGAHGEPPGFGRATRAEVSMKVSAKFRSWGSRKIAGRRSPPSTGRMPGGRPLLPLFSLPGVYRYSP